ncbi:hypothetical protein [Burkholderia ubonensis]|uniref:hypothetical protein n=1 Tax=Burkholderia ubonensis TaxID=101571 RepID=UPI00076C5282|nr:hypothetical protein [Burkholderia ubonensis]KUZ66234.1 hypothetical protein WI37_33530 [Burkholderia ubonensis]
MWFENSALAIATVGRCGAITMESGAKMSFFRAHSSDVHWAAWLALGHVADRFVVAIRSDKRRIRELNRTDEASVLLKRTHTGELEGDVVLHGERATFREDKCQLDFRRQGARIHVMQTGNDGDCGAGMGATTTAITSLHRRSSPDPSLIS